MKLIMAMLKKMTEQNKRVLEAVRDVLEFVQEIRQQFKREWLSDFLF